MDLFANSQAPLPEEPAWRVYFEHGFDPRKRRGRPGEIRWQAVFYAKDTEDLSAEVPL